MYVPMVEDYSRTECFSDQGEEGMERIVVQIRKTISVLFVYLSQQSTVYRSTKLLITFYSI